MKYIFIILYFLFTYSVVIAQDNDLNNEENKKIGIVFQVGSYMLKADVPGNGLGFGVKLHAPVNSTFSLRLNYFTSTNKGISSQPWFHSLRGGGLVEPVYAPYDKLNEGWFPSYKFSQSTIEIEGLLSIIKLLNKQLDWDFKLMDLYIMGGVGIFKNKTALDLLDGSGASYQNLITNTGWAQEKVDTKAGRKEIINKLQEIYDGKYETENVFTNRNKTYSYGAGLMFNISPKFAAGLEYKVIKYPDYDYADGLRFLTSSALTSNYDYARYLSLLAEYKF